MTYDRAGWKLEADGSISYRSRIGSRARAHREALALGHALGSFQAQGAGFVAFATCRRCNLVVREDILERRLYPAPGLFDARCH